MAFSTVLGLCHFIILMCILVFLSQDLEWHRISLETVAGSRIPALTPWLLGCIRATCASVVWGVLLYVTFTRKPLFLTVALRDGKKKLVSLLGLQRYAMFTVWCWTIQGFFFVVAGYCCFAKHFEGENSSVAAYFPTPPEILVHSATILFEISFPVSFVVSSLVTFVLIPHAKKAKMPIDNFFVFVPLVMHNVNIAFMAMELVINKIPFIPWHFPVILIYGMAYIVFSWVWNHCHGYYFYFFLDYTRTGAVLWYIALMIIVGIFFFVGLASSMLMNSSTSIVPSLIIIALTSAVIKVSD